MTKKAKYSHLKNSVKNFMKTIREVEVLNELYFQSISRNIFQMYVIESLFLSLVLHGGVEITEIYSYLTLFWQKIRESNGFTREIIES